MPILRRIWERWQFEVLRCRFPEWDIVRADRDMWCVHRPPVHRAINGDIETVYAELEWFDKLFRQGMLRRGRHWP